ncbi:RHOMBOID-like protein 1 [Cinnamomum micranthum f. kanehirae]|uniref:RHOMBOID-like protein n=1 Tax=Cinnamomum micranthum f. kanehirae TaxID=337451 RepID=A0A443NDY1_9MAGN|nr:RHOMBOID-like protein 1 [Cinnamomum micranthum f. kanehirae]
MGREPSSEMDGRGHPRRNSESSVHPVVVDSSEAMESGLVGERRSQEVRAFRTWSPWLVPLFVVANVLVFSVTMYINNCPKNSSSCVVRFLGRLSFQPFKENPLLGPSSSTLEKMGALEVNKVVNKHQGWRLITCIWLHAGVFHLLANMLSLLFIGIRLEQEFGFVRIGMLYIISGFGGSLLSALFIKASISVGASGALFGLLGGMLSELITNWTIYANKFAALFTLVVIIVINLAVGILPHVDNFAHIGGFISGFLLGFVVLIRPQFEWVSRKFVRQGYDYLPAKPKHKIYQYILWVLALILVIVGFTVGLVMLFRGINANDHCSWCHYLSCIPINGRSCKAESAYCLSSQSDNHLNLTCSSNGRQATYPLSNVSGAKILELCTQLCS